jgi:hypothetical protein
VSLLAVGECRFLVPDVYCGLCVASSVSFAGVTIVIVIGVIGTGHL